MSPVPTPAAGQKRWPRWSLVTLVLLCGLARAGAYEGRLQAELVRGKETNALLYTVGTNCVRVEITATTRPNPIDLWQLKSGTLTLLFPHNRCFVRVKPATRPAPMPGPLAAHLPTGGPPPGVGPQPGSIPGTPALPPGLGPQPGAGALSVAGMASTMAPPMIETLELQPTGQHTNLLGLACAQFEARQRGQTLEVWATDQLFPYRAYVSQQPPAFGPRLLEEEWPALLTERKLFPLRVCLRFAHGAERLRFEVKSLTPQKLTAAEDRLFKPPSGYSEIAPRPF